MYTYSNKIRSIMHVYVYIYIHTLYNLILCICIYIYIYTHIHIHIYICCIVLRGEDLHRQAPHRLRRAAAVLIHKV